MSQFLKIEQALINGFVGQTLGYPTSYPNAAITDESKAGNAWLSVAVLPAESDGITLGDAGEDNNPGVLQVDVNVPIGSGTALQLTILDQLATAFKAGATLQFSGQRVTLRGSSITGPREVGGFSKRSLSVNYYARTTRS